MYDSSSAFQYWVAAVHARIMDEGKSSMKTHENSRPAFRRPNENPEEIPAKVVREGEKHFTTCSWYSRGTKMLLRGRLQRQYRRALCGIKVRYQFYVPSRHLRDLVNRLECQSDLRNNPLTASNGPMIDLLLHCWSDSVLQQRRCCTSRAMTLVGPCS